MPELQTAVYLVIGVLWVLAEAGVAAAAFFRFRFTPAGWLIGGAFALMAVKSVAVQLVNRFALAGQPHSHTERMFVMGISNTVTVLLLLAVAVGIALIPMSLRRLSASRAGNATHPEVS